MATGNEYNPQHTTINENQLQHWLRSKVSADLEAVPGVGPANKQHFVQGDRHFPRFFHSRVPFLKVYCGSKLNFLSRQVGVLNTHQLLGKYLSLKQSANIKEHQDMMYMWLKSIVSTCSSRMFDLQLHHKYSCGQGVNAGRNNIILSLAEKCDLFLDGIYDTQLYGY